MTYSLLMNFPEAIAGAFPVSCEVIFQCEPDAYADDRQHQAQRVVPVAIVHAQRPDRRFSAGPVRNDRFRRVRLAGVSLLR